jgi:predicted HTH domain antitoxin
LWAKLEAEFKEAAFQEELKQRGIRFFGEDVEALKDAGLN